MSGAAWGKRIMAESADRVKKETTGEVIARLERELAAAREKWHDSASLLASATDLLNTQAREAGVIEARDERSIKTVIDALWNDAAQTRLQLAAIREALSPGRTGRPHYYVGLAERLRANMVESESVIVPMSETEHKNAS